MTLMLPVGPAHRHLNVSNRNAGVAALTAAGSTDSVEFVLGRSDERYNVDPDVDLTPFEAYKKGVSRKHAAIKIGDKNEVSLVDLESTNGTWVNGARISPQIPVPLHQGDIIALGKLALQVLIRM